MKIGNEKNNKKNTKWALLFVLQLLFLIFISVATPSQAQNWLDFEGNAHDSYPWPNCFSPSQILTTTSDLNNTTLPTYLSQGQNTTQHYTSDLQSAVAARMTIYAGLLIQCPICLVAAAGTDYLMMQSVCRSAFVFQPQEYAAYLAAEENGGLAAAGDPCSTFAPDGTDFLKCSYNSGTMTNIAQYAPNAPDVPFYFHCDPRYEPFNSVDLDPSVVANAKIIGRTWGYGPQFNLCSSARSQCIGKMFKDNNLMGKIVIGYYKEPNFFSAKNLSVFPGVHGYNGCETTPGSHWPQFDTYALGFGQNNNIQNSVWIGPSAAPVAKVVPFMQLDELTGTIKVCAASVTTFMPVLLGCTNITPPSDIPSYNNDIATFLSTNRCSYIIGQRLDLSSLATSGMGATDANGYNGRPVKNFLQSGFHPLSTIVGCVQDVLGNLFGFSANAPSNFNPPFQTIQNKFKGIIWAAITLYIALFGVKIMLSTGNIERKDYMMAILKLAMVIAFTQSTQLWNIVVPTVMKTPDIMLNIFMNSWESTGDPRKHCEYIQGGSNILNNRDFPANGSPTMGFSTIHVTVWDFIDCKIINYLNMGTCNYTLGGMVAILMIAGSILAGNIILGVVAIIYIAVLLKTVFMYAHIFLLSLFTVTLLILFSPLFITFALFEQTKSIFTQWYQHLIGYTLYPAVPFLLLAIVYTSFDYIYYGDIDFGQVTTLASGDLNFLNACANIDSVFCVITQRYEGANNSACLQDTGNIRNSFINTISLGYNNYYLPQFDLAASRALFTPFMQLMMMALFFSLFSSAGVSLITQLFKVVPFDKNQLAGPSLTGMLGSIGKKLGSVMGSVGDKIGGDSKDGGGGGGAGSGDVKRGGGAPGGGGDVKRSGGASGGGGAA